MSRKSIDFEELQANLIEIITGLKPHDQIEIVRNQQVVAILIGPEPVQTRKPRVPGLLKDVIISMTDDDEHLKDFEEYMY